MPGATVDDMGVGMDGIGSGGYRSNGLPATRPGVRISPPDLVNQGAGQSSPHPDRCTSDNYTSTADLTLSRIQPSSAYLSANGHAGPLGDTYMPRSRPPPVMIVFGMPN
jgi:hypothetical protein